MLTRLACCREPGRGDGCHPAPSTNRPDQEWKLIKDIMVHLTGSQEDEIRLAYAETLSERFEAHLTGLYVHMLPDVVCADPAGMVGMDVWFEESNVQAKEAYKRLEGRFERFRLPHDVRQLDVFSATAGQALTAARTADLFVATRPYGDPPCCSVPGGPVCSCHRKVWHLAASGPWPSPGMAFGRRPGPLPRRCPFSSVPARLSSSQCAMATRPRSAVTSRAT